MTEATPMTFLGTPPEASPWAASVWVRAPMPLAWRICSTLEGKNGGEKPRNLLGISGYMI